MSQSSCSYVAAALDLTFILPNAPQKPHVTFQSESNCVSANVPIEQLSFPMVKGKERKRERETISTPFSLTRNTKTTFCDRLYRVNDEWISLVKNEKAINFH